jgi:hypothetical protein
MMLLSVPSLAVAQAQTTGGETGQTTQATQGGASGDDAIYCRPPQDRTDSRLKGPKVCMTVGEWKKLRARGLDISADGQTVVQSQGSPESMGTPNSLRPQP